LEAATATSITTKVTFFKKEGALPPVSVFETKKRCIVHVILCHTFSDLPGDQPDNNNRPTMAPATLDIDSKGGCTWQFEAMPPESPQPRTHNGEPETYSSLHNVGAAPCTFLLQMPFPMQSNNDVEPKYDNAAFVTVAKFEFEKLYNSRTKSTLTHCPLPRLHLLLYSLCRAHYNQHCPT